MKWLHSWFYNKNNNGYYELMELYWRFIAVVYALLWMVESKANKRVERRRVEKRSSKESIVLECVHQKKRHVCVKKRQTPIL